MNDQNWWKSQNDKYSRMKGVLCLVLLALNMLLGGKDVITHEG
jgi:hypothetical protein